MILKGECKKKGDTAVFYTFKSRFMKPHVTVTA